MISRKSFFICAAALFAIVTISLVGNIITIGDKAAEIHPWVGWGFYIVLGLFVLRFIVWPTLKFLFTPELKGDERDRIDEMESDELKSYIKKMSLTQQERDLFATAEGDLEGVKMILKKRDTTLNTQKVFFPWLVQWIQTAQAASSLLCTKLHHTLTVSMLHSAKL